ncbi:MAG: methyltransferase domain-containing protein [Chloroflexota bacterium]
MAVEPRPGATALLEDGACRICGTSLGAPVVDLGMSPLCERFLTVEMLEQPEPVFPLQVHLCPQCGLAQLREFARPDEIFSEYFYFSSFSASWVEHGRRYADRMIDDLRLGPESLVVEVASNDGYLLQHFRDRDIGILGIEPAQNIARVANAAGIPTLARFFGVDLADELVAGGRRADLIAGNNVLAQVPNLHDFVEGLARLLAPDGLLTLEFPHAQRLLERTQFDTIYHEHFSYFALGTTAHLMSQHGLEVVDVEELPTHGGSLRVHVRHRELGVVPTERVGAVLAAERAAGVFDRTTWNAFADRAAEIKQATVEFLETARRDGRSVAGYGAPGKAVTFLAYCGIGPDLLPYTVDRNTHKQGMFMPGTRTPIAPVERLAETRPDYIWILPWNLRDEIAAQLTDARDWGAQFVVAIPHLEVV